MTEEHGDVGCHGFWQQGRFAIFDVCITDTETRSAQGQDFNKVLAAQEKEKKDKYLDSCLQQHKDFTPLVYLVDGIAGREARNAEKRVGALLVAKWRKPYLSKPKTGTTTYNHVLQIILIFCRIYYFV
jgi:hypothetical protein